MDNISKKMRVDSSKLIIKNLDGLLLLGETLAFLNFSGARSFNDFVTQQKKRLSLLETTTLSSEKTIQIEEALQKLRTVTANPDPTIIKSLENQLEEEKTFLYSKELPKICFIVKEAFLFMIMNPLKENMLSGNLDPLTHAYLMLAQSQMDYLTQYSMIAAATPMAKNFMESILYYKYNLREKFQSESLSKKLSTSLSARLFDMSTASLSGLAGYASARLATKNPYLRTGITLGSLLVGYVGAPKLKEMGLGLLTNKITLETDNIFLSTDVFFNRCGRLHQAIMQISSMEGSLEHLASPELPSFEFMKPIFSIGAIYKDFTKQSNYDEAYKKYEEQFGEIFQLSKKYLSNNLPLIPYSYNQLSSLSEQGFDASSYQSILDPRSIDFKLAYLIKVIISTHVLYSAATKNEKALHPKIKAAYQSIEPSYHELLELIDTKSLALIQSSKMSQVFNSCYSFIWAIAYSELYDRSSNPSESVSIMAQSLLDPIRIILQLNATLESPGMDDTVVLLARSSYLFGLNSLEEASQSLQAFSNNMPSSVASNLMPAIDLEIENALNLQQDIADQAESDVTQKLFLYSSGGGGHKQAMEAKSREALDIYKSQHELSEDPRPLKIDLMLDWLGPIGTFSVEQWDNAQKSGDVNKQEELVAKQPLGNFFFGPVIYMQLYKMLEENPNIREIVNTQAMCNRQVCQAVLDINRMYNRNIKINLIMTDLPTERAVHFWNGLKPLTALERSVITLHTAMPIIDPNLKLSSEEGKNKYYQDFFNQYCGPNLHWQESPLPVRKEFKPGEHATRDEINRRQYLTYKWQHEDELQAFQELQKFTGIHLNQKSSTAQVVISPTDKVMSIMLGSQGGVAILDYIKEIIKIKTQDQNKEKLIFFVYCGAGKDSSSPLFQDVVELIKTTQATWPEGLCIVPLGNQGALSISEGLARTDVAIMRTGGLASFEALTAQKENNQLKFLLHSESKSKNPEELAESIPVWERGNAEYLQSQTGATVVNVQTFAQAYRNLHLSQNISPSLSSFSSSNPDYLPSFLQQKKPKHPLASPPASLLDEKILCKTTGWHNNCGLNCLTHFLFSKLKNNNLQQQFNEDPEYQALLLTFQTYYHLPNIPTWDNIETLLSNLVPHDREAVFAPVLRQHLGKIMLSRHEIENAERMWVTVTGALFNYITNSSIEDMDRGIINSNLAFFEKYRTQYQLKLANISSLNINDAEKNTQIERLKTTISNLAKQEWMDSGFKQYAQYFSDLNNNEMVTIQQLQTLSARLNIGVTVYTPRWNPQLPITRELRLKTNEPPVTGHIYFELINDQLHYSFIKPNRALAAGAIGEFNYQFNAPLTKAQLDQNSEHILNTITAKHPNDMPAFPWAMSVQNRGLHWTYEEPTRSPEKTTEHNAPYEYNQKSLFNTHRGVDENNDTMLRINAHVRDFLNPPAASPKPQ